MNSHQVNGVGAKPDPVGLRVCVLWTRLSGYLAASIHALAAGGVDVLVVHEKASPSAPFDDDVLTSGLPSVSWRDRPDERELQRLLDEFGPDGLVVNSWHVGAYRRIARSYSSRAVRIVTVHNQWAATPKQRVARLAAPLLLHRTYDVAFVCDERQAVFAERLGYPAERIIWGVNTCDHPAFAKVADSRGTAVPPPAFLYVGRLVDDKAIDVLAAAYQQYRRAVADPWPLRVAGVGERADLLRDVPGVQLLGFVQPSDLPDVYAQAGCLVLPSRLEPWGVAIHEAAAAGLPIVCTRACGAASRLVLDGYNGAVVSPGSVEGLAAALCRMSRATDHDRRSMSSASRSLSLQYTPQRWARTVESAVRRFSTIRRESRGDES